MQIEVNGEDLFLDSDGALWWPQESILVFADLHLEKGSAYGRHRIFLPPYDSRTTLSRMEKALEHYTPATVIALGDSFHDREAEERLDRSVVKRLERLCTRANWHWITGNHDPLPPSTLSGDVSSEIAIGNLVFRHEPLSSPQDGEIAGHLHPCASVTGHGRSVRRRCFASDGRRMVLPAMGAYAGGLDVRDAAISRLFEDGFAAYMLGAGRVYAAGLF